MMKQAALLLLLRVLAMAGAQEEENPFEVPDNVFQVPTGPPLSLPPSAAPTPWSPTTSRLKRRYQFLQPKPFQDGASFGETVVQSGPCIVVGAPGISKAFAYRYVSAIKQWFYEGSLEPEATKEGDPSSASFGSVVALSGTTAAVGGNEVDEQHRIHLYERNNETLTWQYVQQFDASLVYSGIPQETSVKVVFVSDELLAVGVSSDMVGRVSLWSREEDDMWTEAGQLKPPSTSQFFGSSFATSEGTLVVGAHSQFYVYVSDKAGNWEIQSEIDVAADGGIVSSLAVPRSGLIIVGDQENQAAYVYTQEGSTWKKTTTLDHSATSVGGTIIARGNLVGLGDPQGGTVHLTNLDSGEYLSVETPGMRDGSDGFGSSLHIDGDTLLVGAPLYPRGSERSKAGTVIAFNLTHTPFRETTVPSDNRDGRYGAIPTLDATTESDLGQEQTEFVGVTPVRSTDTIPVKMNPENALTQNEYEEFASSCDRLGVWRIALLLGVALIAHL